MTGAGCSEPGLPSWVVWQQRPFADANLLMLRGPHPVVVDTGRHFHRPA